MRAQLGELAEAADRAQEYLHGVGLLDGFAEEVAHLVGGSVFLKEGEDLLVHRCMLVWHAVAETYMMSRQGRVVPRPGQDGLLAARYPRGDVKDETLRTLAGPILGHNQVLTVNCAMCSDADMDPAKAFTSYGENLRWLNDWGTGQGADGDIMEAVDAAIGARPQRPLPPGEPAGEGENGCGARATPRGSGSPGGWLGWGMRSEP